MHIRRIAVASWLIAATLAGGSRVLVTGAGAQTAAPTWIWQRITYPAVTLPGTAGEALTLSVASGGHTNHEPSHLRLDLQWSGPNGAPLPTAIANASELVVKLHTADGKTLTASPGPFGSAFGNGTWGSASILPWSRNALDEAWFEVRVPGQTWWLELPYGFARNPEDPEVPDRNRGEPRFPPGVLPLGATDVLVPWLGVEYQLGRTQDGAVLSVTLSHPFYANASVQLYREPTGQVGPDRSRQNLDTPRIAVSIEAGANTSTGSELARRLSEDRHTRTDDFTFGLSGGTGRAFGTIGITIDGQRYGVRVPSSLFLYVHGRTDRENAHWLVESRLGESALTRWSADTGSRYAAFVTPQAAALGDLRFVAGPADGQAVVRDILTRRPPPAGMPPLGSARLEVIDPLPYYDLELPRHLNAPSPPLPATTTLHHYLVISGAKPVTTIELADSAGRSVLHWIGAASIADTVYRALVRLSWMDPISGGDYEPRLLRIEGVRGTRPLEVIWLHSASGKPDRFYWPGDPDFTGKTKVERNKLYSAEELLKAARALPVAPRHDEAWAIAKAGACALGKSYGGPLIGEQAEVEIGLSEEQDRIVWYVFIPARTTVVQKPKPGAAFLVDERDGSCQPVMRQ